MGRAGVQLKRSPHLTPQQRGLAAIERVRAGLREGNRKGALLALADARALANATEPPLIAEDELNELKLMIETMPKEALQVLRYGPTSPFSALGVERLKDARTLNAVNKRTLLKQYRKLALTLHPDRCDHALALDAMQALNKAFEQTQLNMKAGKLGGHGGLGSGPASGSSKAWTGARRPWWATS